MYGSEEMKLDDVEVLRGIEGRFELDELRPGVTAVDVP